MVDRVTQLDLTVWSGGNIALMRVLFPATVPPSGGHRYTVPLRLVDIRAQWATAA